MFVVESIVVSSEQGCRRVSAVRSELQGPHASCRAPFELELCARHRYAVGSIVLVLSADRCVRAAARAGFSIPSRRRSGFSSGSARRRLFQTRGESSSGSGAAETLQRE